MKVSIFRERSGWCGSFWTEREVALDRRRRAEKILYVASVCGVQKVRFTEIRTVNVTGAPERGQLLVGQLL